MSRIDLYYATWCGHCTRFKSEWENLKKELDKNNISHGEFEEGRDNDKIKNEGIMGYPTIKVTLGNGKSMEYDGERTASSILNFLKENNNNNNNNNKDKNDDDDKYLHKYQKYKTKYVNSSKGM